MAVLGVQIDLSKANECICIQEVPDSKKSMVISTMEFPEKDERLGVERGRIIINCTYNIIYYFHKYYIYIYIGLKENAPPPQRVVPLGDVALLK